MYETTLRFDETREWLEARLSHSFSIGGGSAFDEQRAPAQMIRSLLHSSLGCRISPRRRPFVVDLYNGLDAADVESPCRRGVVGTSAVLVGDFSNALDLCDTHRSATMAALSI